MFVEPSRDPEGMLATFKTFNHFIIPHNKTSDFKVFFVRKE